MLIFSTQFSYRSHATKCFITIQSATQMTSIPVCTALVKTLTSGFQLEHPLLTLLFPYTSQRLRQASSSSLWFILLRTSQENSFCLWDYIMRKMHITFCDLMWKQFSQQSEERYLEKETKTGIMNQPPNQTYFLLVSPIYALFSLI